MKTKQEEYIDDYIRKAVELANEFEIHHDGKGFVRYFDKDRQNFISFYFHSDYKDELQFGSDALAAQLVRQVDSLGDDVCMEISSTGGMRISQGLDMKELAIEIGPDRTMNTIIVIVDSEVLK